MFVMPDAKLVIAAVVLGATAASAQSPATDSLLVSPAWLAAHLNDPSVVVVHVAGNRRDYLNGHVPGARFLWTGTFAPSNPDLSTEMAPIAALDSALEAIGVTDRSRIVLYGPSPQMTARMFMTLDYLGASGRASLLDGGLGAWKADGHQVSTETPAVKRGSFTPRVNRGVIADADAVKSMIEKPATRILDARAPMFYNGDPGGMLRGGHIPSANNIPFNTLLADNGRFKDRAALVEMFKAAGVNQGDQVVTYCHVGQQASLLYFTARYLGFNARLYDGSFEDWSGRMELPVAKPDK
jgi:thiosulfate/3-mercaptopyruvate sulfurtransferase